VSRLAHELGATFLFESLSTDQLEGLAALGTEIQFETGDVIFLEGQPGEFLWVLLDGEMELERHVGGQRIQLVTVTRPGTYGGGVGAFSGSSEASGYRATARAVRPSRFFRLPSDDLARLLAEWSPVAKHFLDGYLQQLEDIEKRVRERERLISLGRMAAQLAHEVNNPAAASLRGVADLRDGVQQLQHVVAWIAQAAPSPELLRSLVDLQAAAGGAPPPPPRRALEVANAEEEVGGWLEDHDVDNAWMLAATLTSAGLDAEWLDRSAQTLGSDALSPGLNWIAASLGTTSLVAQVEEALGRIVQLVGAVKEYSYMDRAPEQEVDVQDGIEKTLLVLGPKLRSGVEIERDYEEHLPAIMANGAELNQVWTNLIDNAIDAIDGRGQIVIRTRREENFIVVDVEDHGPGIPAEVRSRIFDPFYTTKEPGKGTGLGLDIVRRIVVEGHHGDVSVDSEPGRTRFSVRLPLGAPR
jgi:signal transduction histidine kinase